MDDTIMTRAEAAARLKISVRQFDRLPLRRVSVGRLVRIRKIDFDEFVERNVKEPPAAPELRRSKGMPIIGKKMETDWLGAKLAALKQRPVR